MSEIIKQNKNKMKFNKSLTETFLNFPYDVSET